MRQVRSVRQPRYDCRWRLWRLYGPGAQAFATRDVAEHMCDGAFIWVARLPDGVTWMTDECPITVMDAIELVSPAMVEWVIDQTLAVLGSVLGDVSVLDRDSSSDAGARLLDEIKRDDRPSEVMSLLIEFVRFSEAARVLAGRFERMRHVPEGEHGEEPTGDAERAAA